MGSYLGLLHIGENVATKKDCRDAVINAYGSLERGELGQAHSFIGDAYKLIGSHINGTNCFTEEPPERGFCFSDWWIVRQLNPLRWFRRLDRPTDLDKPKRRVTLKKAIVLIACSVAAGVGSNYLTDFGGPTELERGQFTSIQQCDSCEAIRTEGKVCTQCGTSEATEKIAAPLRAQHLGGFFQSEAGWQFKDGSTQLNESGEYIVPELVVMNTRRM